MTLAAADQSSGFRGRLKSLPRDATASVLRSVVFPGRYRVYRFLASVLGDQPVPFTVPIGNGAQLTVTNESWNRVFYLGDFDANVRWFMTRRIDKNSIVFDVGASIGMYSVPLAKKVSHIYAFETLRANYDVLLRNLEQNGIINVTATFGAVSDKNGCVSAPIRGAGDYSLASEGEGFIDIPAISLDDFAKSNGISRVDVMKIDIEGSETKALRGARDLFMSKAVCNTVIEFNPYWLRKMGSSPNELYDLFEEYGLSVHLLTRSGRARKTNRREVISTIASPGCLNLVLTP